LPTFVLAVLSSDEPLDGNCTAASVRRSTPFASSISTTRPSEISASRRSRRSLLLNAVASRISSIRLLTRFSSWSSFSATSLATLMFSSCRSVCCWKLRANAMSMMMNTKSTPTIMSVMETK
jgi:hypothetical protein